MPFAIAEELLDEDELFDDPLLHPLTNPTSNRTRQQRFKKLKGRMTYPL